MRDLIEALIIFLKYENLAHPTICEHDVLIIVGVSDIIDPADAERLNDLGFNWNTEYSAWASTKFGSA